MALRIGLNPDLRRVQKEAREAINGFFQHVDLTFEIKTTMRSSAPGLECSIVARGWRFHIYAWVDDITFESPSFLHHMVTRFRALQQMVTDGFDATDVQYMNADDEFGDPIEEGVFVYAGADGADIPVNIDGTFYSAKANVFVKVKLVGPA